jgi:hypothetical protein
MCHVLLLKGISNGPAPSLLPAENIDCKQVALLAVLQLSHLYAFSYWSEDCATERRLTERQITERRKTERRISKVE